MSPAVTDADCVAFLQWALPRLDLRWQGLRKVRGQVCKRLRRRLGELGLEDLAAYRQRLEGDPDEWHRLDACCHKTISRFYRDQAAFEVLRERVLPDIAARTTKARRPARAWSIGCVSGEEPYRLRILWDFEIEPRFPGAAVTIVATDVDEAVLQRAHEGCYPGGSLRELPPALRERAFAVVDGRYSVRPAHRQGVTFLRQDVRCEAPEGPFDLVLYRNLAFTYLDEALQRTSLDRMLQRLAPLGYLVIGALEQLPSHAGLVASDGLPGIFTRSGLPVC